MLNPSLLKFKDKYVGKSVAVIGNGPTFNLFDTSKKIITFGCNQHIKAEKIILDHYFIGDAENEIKGYNSDPARYKDYLLNKHPDENYIRINGYTRNTSRCASVPRGLGRCNYYITNEMFIDRTTLSTDPTLHMSVGASIVFEMLQVALFSRPKNLYLVGMDCTLNLGTFVNEITRSIGTRDSKALAEKHWLDAKEFIDEKYPDINIYIINPVRMKLFQEAKMEDIVEN